MTVITAAHCLCCYHDTNDKCALDTTHHCKNARDEDGRPTNQILGTTNENNQPSTREPFNVASVVLGLKRTPDSSSPTHDQVLRRHFRNAFGVYIRSGQVINGKINLNVKGYYDIGIVKVRMRCDEFAELGLDSLRLPTMKVNYSFIICF